jgi:CubicO group peptidase (beta-lactamase class C family)
VIARCRVTDPKEWTMAASPFSRCAALCVAALLACLAAPPTHAAPPASALVALDDGLRPNVLPADAPLPRWSLDARMRHYRVPGVAIAIVRGGQVVEARGYGLRVAGGDAAVDADTLFSVGSVSKVVTAVTALRLVDAGQLQLDRDVGPALKRWQIPDVAGREGAITLRMLMSHTSGLNVHGFADYLPAEPVPTLVQVLQGVPPAKNAAVTRRFAPGERNDYSGGAVTVEQLLIEDSTGQPLAQVAEAQLLAPLGMRRSTFENPLPASRGNIAQAHDESGAPTALPRGWETFAEAGASGFWTSANDLGAFVATILSSYQGQDALLRRDTAVQMLTPVARSWFGLGPRLDGEGPSRTFHHGGANDSYRAWIEGYPETGDGFVILTNGANGNDLAREIRNALTDALGHGDNALLRTLSSPAPPSADLAGRYRLDPQVPMEVRGALADVLEDERFEMQVVDGGLAWRLPEATSASALHPLAPNRYASGSGALRFLFHRGPDGRVNAVSVLHPASDARALYRRE